MQDKSKGIYILMDAFIIRHACYCAGCIPVPGRIIGTKILTFRHRASYI
jgi:hypothetical protein